MKKVISFVIMLSMFLTLPCFAIGNADTRFDYEDEGISVIFSEESELDQDQRQDLADRLVYGTQKTEAMPASIMCTLFGHKTSVDSVIAIHHKVRSTAPRCLKEYIDVEECSRCDYETQTVVFSGYIDCCPLD